MIENATRAVIVPYNDEAREIISALNGDISPAECVELQRRAQQYTVGVYPDEFKEMEDSGAIYQTKSEAFALMNGYYDQSLGMVSNGMSETYIF